MQKLNGIEKEAFVISRKKDWDCTGRSTKWSFCMNAVCRACAAFSELPKEYWSSTGKWKREARRPRKPPFFTNRNAAPQIYCELIHVEKLHAAPSSAQKNSRSRVRLCTITQSGGNRAGCDIPWIHGGDAPGAVGNFLAEELDARKPGRTFLRDLPVRTDSLMVYLKEEYGVTFPRFELGPLAEQFYLVSNRRGKLGAICMCYPGVLESLSQRFEASLYVIPSSIHECMVIPDYDVFPEECLSDMVRDVNEKTVKPQEILSDHVYYYHRESGELTLCEEET